MKKECHHCDFCEKSQYEVKKICLGPRHIAICNECAELAVEVMREPTVCPLPTKES